MDSEKALFDLGPARDSTGSVNYAYGSFPRVHTEKRPRVSYARHPRLE